MKKPFDLDEVLARIQSNLRRCNLTVKIYLIAILKIKVMEAI